MLRKIFAGLTACLLLFITVNHITKEQVNIAFIGPLSGGQASLGRQMLNGAKLSVDLFNRNAIGKKIILHIYDDKDDPQLAKEIASKLPANIVAVLGHGSSDTAVACQDIYQARALPVLLPVATNDKLQGFFRMAYTDKQQAEYMCLYAKYVLKQDSISVIYSDSVFGRGLAGDIIQFADQLNIAIKAVVLPNQIQQLEGTVLCATHAIDSQIVVDSPEAGRLTLLGSDVFSDIAIKDNVKAIATMPFMFDTAVSNYFKSIYRQKFGQKPAWASVYAYDGMQILLDKIHKDKPIMQALQDDRRIGYKHRPRSIDQYTISKPLDFTKEERELYFVENSYGNLQLCNSQLSPGHAAIPHVEDLVLQGRVIKTPYNSYFYKTDIVRAGMSIANIVGIDLKRSTCMLDFYLWLVHDVNLRKAGDIVFTNSIHSLTLKSKNAALIESKIVDGRSYRLYRIVDEFKLDTFAQLSQSFYGQKSNMGVSLRNQLLGKNLIRYVQQASEVQTANLNSLNKTLKHLGWEASDLKSFEGEENAGSFGDPYSSTDVEFSSLNMKLEVKKLGFSIFDLLTYQLAYRLLVLSLCLILIVYFGKLALNRPAGMVDALSYALCLLPLQYLVMDHVAFSSYLYAYKFSIQVLFDAGWWFILAWLISIMTHRLVWDKLAQKRPVPRLLYLFVDSLLYMSAVLCVTAFVLNKPVASLVTSISLLGVLFVMAVKMNVSNVFSGFFLNVEGCLRLGDWIEVDEMIGKVIRINWRSTAIQMREGTVVNIPNSSLAEVKILNYTYPHATHGLLLQIVVSIYTKPEYVETVITSAIELNDLIIATKVGIESVDRYLAHYRVVLVLSSYSDAMVPEIKAKYYKKIWEALDRAGIGMGVPAKRLVYYTNLEEQAIDRKEIIARLGWTSVQEYHFVQNQLIGQRGVLLKGSATSVETLKKLKPGSMIDSDCWALSDCVVLGQVE